MEEMIFTTNKEKKDTLVGNQYKWPGAVLFYVFDRSLGKVV